MKHLIIIATLIATLASFTAQADGEQYLVIAVRKATWDDASPTKRDKIKTFFRRFVTDGHGVRPQAIYLTAASNEVMVACYSMDKLQNRNGEDIDPAKIADLQARLNDNQIRIEPTNDPHALLASWGLVTPPSDELP